MKNSSVIQQLSPCQRFTPFRPLEGCGGGNDPKPFESGLLEEVMRIMCSFWSED